MYYLMNKNEKIAKTAFEGGLHGRHLSTTSPEYGTDGSFAKCWIRLPYAVEPDEFTYGGTYYRDACDHRCNSGKGCFKNETDCGKIKVVFRKRE